MVRLATQQDISAVAALACELWPGHAPEEMTAEFSDMLLNGESTIVVYDAGGAGCVAFAQCGLRHDYVEGTETSPVGYLEGIYVRPEYRNQGVAAGLLACCEDWAAQQGCVEFASDCELDNVQSLRFHLHHGFEEANRIICFTKKLRRKQA